MIIYTSTKVVPYVYICIHKETKQFYIGSRYTTKLKLPSHLDFPAYKTSAPYIKENFDDYTWYIVAEFYNGDDAYDFEQQLIHEHWNNTLLLNEQYRLSNGKKRFKSQFGRIATKECRDKIKAARATQIITEGQKNKISNTLKGRPSPNKGKTASISTRAKLSVAGYKRKQSTKTRSKISQSNRKPIEVNGTNYDSPITASLILSIKYTTLVARLKSKNYPTYLYK